MLQVKSAQQIHGMRESCARARDILREAGEAVKPGVTTDQIDEVVHNGETFVSGQGVRGTRRPCKIPPF